MEFRGVVNFNDKGEVVCFCSQEEYLRGSCTCKFTDDCPDAVISIDVIPGSRPSEMGIQKVKKTLKVVAKETTKLKEGLAQLEKAIKGKKFRL
jgi:hypothetical protein